MKTDSFSEASLRFAYEQAAETVNKTLEEFVEDSKFFSFSVTNLGSGLSIDVECLVSLDCPHTRIKITTKTKMISIETVVAPQI